MDVEKLLHDWRENVADYSKAKADQVYLTEYRKSKKALLEKQAALEGLKTGQEREAYAYAHNEYLEVLEGLRAATQKAEELRYRMKIAEERVNVWRTKQANGRREKDHYGA